MRFSHDEAKGKIVSELLAKRNMIGYVDGVVVNAGHTIYINEKYVTHIVPAGVFYGSTQAILDQIVTLI